MDRPYLPLNALKAFEASARHLSFTRAALELRVTQAAVSHHVKALEARLGATLFHRWARGLILTDEGQALLPVLTESFDRISRVMARFEAGAMREVLTVGVVGTFAVRWLLPRIASFRESHPLIDLRIQTHNNKVDLAAEGLDMAIRFGAGTWPGLAAVEILGAQLTPLCTPQIARRLDTPQALASFSLLRSYRREEWPAWFAAAGVDPPPPQTGPIFDSLSLMVQAAGQGIGVALAPSNLFAQELETRQLVQPYSVGVHVGSYWLTWTKSKPASALMTAFRDWCLDPVFRSTTQTSGSV